MRVLEANVDSTKMTVGQIRAAQIKDAGQVNSLRDVEFKVYSQWGDDGIIEYLITQIGNVRPTFVEFGVENYTESNTRFLLKNRNWRGLVIDGSPTHIGYILDDSIYWQQDLKAVSAFITAENINDLLSANGMTGEIGLLSIDIDGNDYWVWQAIQVVNPQIVVCEFNSVFGAVHDISIPYDPKFKRTQGHFSNLYFGASLTALKRLAKEKGYTFVGCNSAGVNAFFVREDCASSLSELSERAFVDSVLKQSRSRSGELSFLSGHDRIEAIKSCQVYDFEKKQLVTIQSLMDL